MLRAFKILIFLAVLIVVAGGAGVGWLFFRAMPHYAGQAALRGLSERVQVVRDEYGVPHIFAANMNDAARALGYIHASERLFQMEMQRRAGQGRLAEVVGPDMLSVDKFVRTLGLYRLAESSFEALSPEAQKFIQAYADGVNAWLDAHRNELPPEFLVLHIVPEKWKPADSIVWGKLMALQLSKNYKSEILRAQLASKITDTQMKALFAPPPADAPVTLEPKLETSSFERPAYDPFEQLARFTGLGHPASNEWVISGKRTASGKPILANDPHLGLEAPILWYLVRIVTPGLTIKGATVPGLPIVLLGQNDNIAWGFTTTGDDVQDLYVETLAGDGTGYMTPDGPKPFETRTETIHVKDAPDVQLKVRSTRHGPVMSDIDPALATLAGDGKVMAFAFTALGDKDTTSEALMRLNRATDWKEFLAALKLYQSPTQNVVYADIGGHIGFISPGLVPIRKKGDGLKPVDGASGDYDWSGMIPFAQLPQAYDPAPGVIFNANNAIVGSDYPYFIGADWEEPYRAYRIQQFLNMPGKQTLDTSARMQADHFSIPSRQLLPYLLAVRPQSRRDAEAVEMLREWDGNMDRDEAQPLIFDAWLHEMHWLLLGEKTGVDLGEKGPYAASSIATILKNDPTEWCRMPTCSDTIAQALDSALDLLEHRDGGDMKQWRWGNEHIARLRHKFYDKVPVLRYVAKLDVPSSGDFYTLDRGGSGGDPDPDAPFARRQGGGYRGIYDLADPSKSRFMIATGESGHIFSPYYGNLVGLWNDVKSFPLTGTREELKKRGLPEFTLLPTQ